jgi:hypothetical protein
MNEKIHKHDNIICPIKKNQEKHKIIMNEVSF